MSHQTYDPLIFQLILASGQTQAIIDFRIMFEPTYSLMAKSQKSLGITAMEIAIKNSAV